MGRGKGTKGNERLCRVTFKGANLLQMLLVTTTAVLIMCLLALVEATNSAEATALPDNGQKAFSSHGSDGGDHDIYTLEPDGEEIEPTWQSQQDTKSRTVTVHPPDTGGPPLLLVGSVLLISLGVLLFAVVKRWM